jgi:hypothetical protein
MFFPGFFFSPYYFLFAAPALLLGLYAQFKIRAAYSKWSKVPNGQGMTGLQAARSLLSAANLYDVQVGEVPGQLTDQYDPRRKTLGLSAGVGRTASVASIGIVAHEVGHAIQDAQGYGPMRMRSSMVGAVNIGTMLGPIVFILGYLLQTYDLALLGIVLFSAAAVFSLVTLPVERNASSRALALLQSTGMVSTADYKGAKSVLDAAALTYVAAAAQSISTLLYYVFLLGGVRRRS